MTTAAGGTVCTAGGGGDLVAGTVFAGGPTGCRFLGVAPVSCAAELLDWGLGRCSERTGLGLRVEACCYDVREAHI